jgi:hypothetical protein
MILTVHTFISCCHVISNLLFPFSKAVQVFLLETNVIKKSDLNSFFNNICLKHQKRPSAAVLELVSFYLAHGCSYFTKIVHSNDFNCSYILVVSCCHVISNLLFPFSKAVQVFLLETNVIKKSVLNSFLNNICLKHQKRPSIELPEIKRYRQNQGLFCE